MTYPNIRTREQHLNVWRDRQWVTIDPSSLFLVSSASTSHEAIVGPPPSPTLRILTWNVEAGTPFWNERLQALLDHVVTSVEPKSERPIDIFCIQELSTIAFPTLLNHTWVRDNFYITDVSSSKWRMALGQAPSEFAFGSVTLIRKSVNGLTDVAFVPKRVYRIDYISHMRRDALVVDFVFPSNCISSKNTIENASQEGTKPMSLRAVNVHLESLPHHPPLRPGQLSICAQHLKEMDAGFVAGDFNAIEPSDENLAEGFGLSDAWKQLYQREGAESITGTDSPSSVADVTGRAFREGMVPGGETWGIQARESFPPGRLDRVAIHGMEPLALTVIPCGKMEELGYDCYWSDHCGVLGDIQVTGTS